MASKENHKFVQFIFHIGARTDTTEFDKTVFDELNLNYTKEIWNDYVLNLDFPLSMHPPLQLMAAVNMVYKDDHALLKS